MYDLSDKPNPRVLSFFAWAQTPLLSLVAIVAGSISVLWLVPSLAAHAPAGWSKMTVVTCIAVLLSAGSLAFSGAKSSTRAVCTCRLAALAVLAIGAVSMALGVYLRLTSGTSSNWLQFLPSPQSAAAFVLIGASLLLIRHPAKDSSKFADFFVITLFALVLFLLAGHIFRLAALVGAVDGRLTSVQTLFCLSLLTIVLAGRLADARGFLSGLAGTGAGSRYSREILPFVVAAPFVVFALVDYLNDSGVMVAAHSRAIITPLVVLAALGIIAWMGQRINDLESDLLRQSLTDQLTDVLNRRGFDAVSQYAFHIAGRMGSGLLIFYFDLDGLKRVNDEAGHEAGSLMIKRFAETLVSTFRKNDVVARVGGDEFVVLALGTKDSVRDILARLNRNIELRNIAENDGCKLSFSVGYAEVPNGETDLEGSIALADERMYLHKQSRYAGRSVEPAQFLPETGAEGAAAAAMGGDGVNTEVPSQKTDTRAQLRRIAREIRRKGYLAEDGQGGDEAGGSIAESLPRAQRRN